MKKGVDTLDRDISVGLKKECEYRAEQSEKQRERDDGYKARRV